MAGENDVKCNPEVKQGAYFMGSLMAVSGIMATVLVLSGLFHSVLRRVGQPSIISHILAGIMVGPTVLGRYMDLRELGMRDAGTALSGTIYFVRMVFMFFIGLELDLVYLRQNLRRSVVVAFGGSALCLFLAALGGPFFYGLLHPEGTFHPDKIYASTALFAIVLTSTASPVLIRVITELKLAGSETGQLAIGAAFANDMASLAALSVISVSHTVYGGGGIRGKKQQPAAPSSPAVKAMMLARMAVTVWVAMSVATWVARLLNRVKRGRQHISKYELCGMLLLIVGLAMAEQLVGYSASMTAFLIGLAMPREGPTARTIMDRLSYPVHEVITPICFGAIGARLDFTQVVGRFSAAQVGVAVAFTTMLSATGKVAGTVMAGKALGIPAREAVVLGALLNVKGYADVLAINFSDKFGVWGETAQVVLLLSSIVNTFMVGPASATIVRWQHHASRYRSRCLQDLRPDHELRMVVCVHGAVDVHPMLTLAYLSRAHAPMTVNVLHLVELVTSRKYALTHQLYHAGAQRDAGDDDDEWGYARDIERVAAAVTSFTNDNAIPVRQMTAVSAVASMDEDVRNSVDDARASLVVVPFHKELRYDGRMVCRREGRRQLNQRVLQRTPCSVGILVERRLFEAATDGRQEVQQVAAVFLGGADDREAAAYAARLAAHPWVSVTVCRFLPASPCPTTAAGEEATADEEFMADLHARFISPGQVSYTEKVVSNGVETLNTLSSMAPKFSLFIVGKGSGGCGAGAEAMTCGMGDWDKECPELGPIGELLASDDVVGGGSVLVMQQHGVHASNKMRTWKDAGPSTDAVVDISKDPPRLFTSNQPHQS
ncbi:hypothetical protein EJB05_35600 [Eragrostis curvula]|uniref:Uncharacterized protein n=1 Tax=Eragrostis curvula TaxID=38414 RepID=A0A5J9U8F8_9POAL|nr:hypothetical protein EJB05_35600 [Eragrostis curvula]